MRQIYFDLSGNLKKAWELEFCERKYITRSRRSRLISTAMKHDSNFGFSPFSGIADKIPQKDFGFAGHSDLLQKPDNRSNVAVDSRKCGFVVPATGIGEKSPHEKMQFQFVVFIVFHAPKAKPQRKIV